MRILFAAEEAAGAQAVKAAVRSGHEVVAVLTGSPPNDQQLAPVSGVASRLGLQVWPAGLVKQPEFADRISSEGVDILLNVHSLYIIDEAVLRAPATGCFNLHPGPLPRYAGLNTVSWAIYNGDAEYGATVHWMEPRVDTGAIAYQTLFPVSDHETGLSLSTKCARAGVRLLEQLLEVARHDPARIPAKQQDLSQRTLFLRGRIPQHGRVDWTRSAIEVERFVRACDYGPFTSPWGPPLAEVEGRQVGIVRARATGQPCDAPSGTVGPVEDAGVAVAAADAWVRVERVAYDGRVTSPVEFLRSGQQFASPHVEGGGAGASGTLASR